MNPVLENVLVTVLVPIVPVLGTLLTLLLYRLIGYVAKRLKIENDNYYLEAVHGIVYDSINYVAQTYVDTLKAQNRFTPEAQAEAFEMAKSRVLNLLTTDGKAVIERVYGDYNLFLDSLIERIVREMKG